jgi:hypothetical protein
MKTFGLALLVKENAVPFGVFLIISGFYFCLLAYRYVKVTRILTGCAFVLFVTVYVIMYHVPLDLKSLYFWLVIMGCLLAGLLLGCLISKFPWITSTLLGALIGFIFGSLVFQATVIAISASPVIMYWIIECVFTFIGFYMGYKYPKHILITSSAFLGSYSIIRVIFILTNRVLELCIIISPMNTNLVNLSRERNGSSFINSWIIIFMLIYFVFSY